MKLYVPIRIKALMVGRIDDSYTNIADDNKRFNIDKLGEYVPTDTFITNEIDKGIHLHFSVADALTRGVVDENENTIYPQIPNVWIVTRIWQKPNDNTIFYKDFYIESDYISEVRNEFNYGSHTWPYKNKQNYIYVGRSFTDKSLLNTGSYLDSLTIEFAGNPLYSAFYYSSRNVIGFYDDLLDDDFTNCIISYNVVGYYSKEEKDPLYKVNDLKSKLDELGWKINQEVNVLHTTLHGCICNLKWIDFETCYESVDDVINPEVSIGNTSLEALSSLLAHHNARIKDKIEYVEDKLPQERLLLHLLRGSYKELLDLNGIIRSENEIYKSFFKPSEGGFTYGISYPHLNDLEDQLFLKTNTLTALIQKSLNEVYKSIKYKQTPVINKDEINKLKKEITSLNQTIQNELSLLSEKPIRKPKPSFYEPNDPSIVLSKIQRDYSRGKDDSFSDDGLLLVRVNTITKSFVSEYLVLNDFDDELIFETVILSNEINLITNNNYTLVEFKKIRLAPYALASIGESNFEVSCLEVYKELGPSKKAVNYYESSWYPLFFDWKVIYFHDELLPKLDSWTLDSGYDYSNISDTFSKKGVGFSGRTFLTSYVSTYLSDVIKDIDMQNSQNCSVLSQSLGSFNEQFSSYNQRIALDKLTLLDKYNNEDLKLLFGEDDYSVNTYKLDGFTSLLRGGYMMVDELSIIGSFGQIKKYSPFDCYTCESMRLNISNSPNRIVLPPRIIQPTRFSFEYEKDPILLWIVPNFIDKYANIFVKERQIITIYSINDKIEFRIPITNKIETNLNKIIDNPEIVSFLEGLKNNNSFTILLDHINDCFERVNSKNNTFSYFDGRPIALIKGSVLLELKYPQFDNSLEEFNIPIYAGNFLSNYDGVIGVYTNNYNSITLSEKINSSNNYFKSGSFISLTPKFNSKERTSIKILMDPFSYLNFTSGILPVEEYKIDEDILEQYKKQINYKYFITTLLTDGNEITLPLPVIEKTIWKWVTIKEDPKEAESVKPIKTLSNRRSVASDGTLVLTRNEDQND